MTPMALIAHITHTLGSPHSRAHTHNFHEQYFQDIILIKVHNRIIKTARLENIKCAREKKKHFYFPFNGIEIPFSK